MALIETYKEDNLIADNTHTATVNTVVVKSGEGELKRGSLLMRDANNKFVLADTSAGTAEVILAVDCDATESDVIGDAYVTGDFRTDALIVADGYAITEADRVNLKNAGIYLIDGMTM